MKIKEYTTYYKNRLRKAIDTLSKESRINLSTTGVETDSILFSLTTFSTHWSNFILLDNSNKIIAFSRIKDSGKLFEIQGFFVPQDLQRKGYGSHLMCFLIGYTKGKKGKGLTLEVRKGNSKGIAFYKTFGFKRTRLKDLEVYGMVLRF